MCDYVIDWNALFSGLTAVAAIGALVLSYKANRLTGRSVQTALDQAKEQSRVQAARDKAFLLNSLAVSIEDLDSVRIDIGAARKNYEDTPENIRNLLGEERLFTDYLNGLTELLASTRREFDNVEQMEADSIELLDAWIRYRRSRTKERIAIEQAHKCYENFMIRLNRAREANGMRPFDM